MKNILIYTNNIGNFFISDDEVIDRIASIYDLDVDNIDIDDYESEEEYDQAVSDMHDELHKTKELVDIDATSLNVFVKRVKENNLIDDYISDVRISPDNEGLIFEMSDEQFELIERVVFIDKIEEFKEYYRKNFGSRDGYMSFLPSDIGEVWCLFKILEAPKVSSTIIAFLLDIENFNKKSIEYDEYFDEYSDKSILIFK